jgi:hypothetical protein
MRKIAIAVCGVFLFLTFSKQYAFAAAGQEITVVDDAEGFAAVIDGNLAAARKEAERTAYNDALRKASEVLVYGARMSEEIEENNDFYSNVREKIFRQSQGIVKNFKVKNERIEKITDPKTGEEHQFLHVTASCKVSLLALDGVLGPAVIDAIGNPRVVFLIDEQVGGKKSSLSAVETESLRVFEKAGYLLVNPAQAGVPSNIPASAYDTPEKWRNSMTGLNAEVIILGEAGTSHALRSKSDGVSIFLVKARAHLKAILVETGHQISSKAAEFSLESTRPLDAGAAKGLTNAASIASKELIHKIAYALAFGTTGSPGLAVNIKIKDVSFKEAEAITKGLQRIVGQSGGVYERSYKNNLLELDVVSENSAKSIASFLSKNEVEIESFTSHTVSGRMIH